MAGNSSPPSRIGVVVHPSRDIDEAFDGLREWAERHDSDVAQVAMEGQERQVADERPADDCDLIVAIGGDGTTLAAIRAAAEADRPVLGVACGSLGVLTTVAADSVAAALDSFASGDWTGREIPALQIEREDGDDLMALNDVVITRRGEGQVATDAHVDGELYARFVGDGFVVSTPVGSSAYTLAAGGPMLAPGSKTFVLTPLAAHGGCIPPLVVGERSRLHLDISPGYGGIRLELDGQTLDTQPEGLTIGLHARVAMLVRLPDQESLMAGLRRRQIIMDSPRILARDKRRERHG